MSYARNPTPRRIQIQRRTIVAAVACALFHLAVEAQAQTAASEQSTAAPQSGLATPAQAPVAAPSSDAINTQQLDTITVTGIGASLKKSMDTKRAQDTVTDVVSAEDIGKLPAKNVADALQSLPGVITLSGSGGGAAFDENDRVALRGGSPSMALTTVNGHFVSSGDWNPADQLAGGGANAGSAAARSVSYLLFPSEIVSQAIVHKSQQADMVEGGITGSIDILTRKPLDAKENFSGQVTVGGVYADLPDKTKPQFNALLNWKNDAGTLGVLVQAFDEQRSLRQDGSLNQWGTVNSNWAAAQLSPGDPGYIPAGTAFVTRVTDQYFQQKRKRTGGMIDIQFKPTDDLELNFDGFYSKLKTSYFQSNSEGNFGLSLQGNQIPTNVSVENGLLTSAQFANAGNNFTGTQLESYYNPMSYASTSYYDASFKFRASDALDFSGTIGTTEGKAESSLYGNYLFFVDTPTAYAYHGANSPASFTLPAGVSPGNFTMNPYNSGSDVSNSVQYSSDKEDYFNLDGTLTLGEGIFSDIKAGVRYSEHTRKGLRPQKAGTPENATQNGQVSAGTFPTIGWGGSVFPGNFGNNLGGGAGGTNGSMPILSPITIIEWSLSNLGNDPVFNKPVSGEFNVKEQSTSAYLMTDLAGEQWHGNVGVRLVSTDDQVLTNTGLSCGNPVNTPGLTYGSPEQAVLCAPFVPPDGTLITGSRFGNFYQRTVRSGYTKVLPSGNFAYDLSEDLTWRVSAAQAMARPDFGALGATIGSFGYVPGGTAGVNLSTAAGGNPTLKPIFADVYDTGMEWYFAPRSILSAHLFYIHFDSLISSGTSVQNLFNTAVPVGNGGPQFIDTVVTSPVSTTGRAKGVELGYEQPIWGGFGVNANYTYTNGKEASGNAILGVPENVYNLGAYFENEKFNARVSWTHRSLIRVGLYGGGQNFQAPVGNLSASLGYNVTDNLSLTLDGLNLNNPTYRNFTGPTAQIPFDQTTALLSNGRQYYFSVRYKF